jgi:serine/threonine protein phosphatase PrpC
MISRSHQGLVRLNNEDCVHCDAEGRFVVLADGMGGLLAGEVASAIAVDTTCKGLRNPELPRDNGDDLAESLREAHAAVVTRAKKMRYVGKMGTTLVAWALGRDSTHDDAQISYFSHVGDSRLYTYSAGTLTQVTRDHTMAQRLIDDGTIAPEDEHTAPNRHVLTQAMGLPGIFATDAGEVPPSERILICSDGLSDLVRAPRIAELMATSDLDDCANLLLKAALDKGGRDNVTVALIEF